MKTFTLGQSKMELLALVKNQKIVLVKLGDKNICLTRDGEEFFAFEALCPHRLAPLHQGFLNGLKELICPLHQYRFDLKTGRTTAGNCRDLEVYSVKFTEFGLEISI